MLLWTAINLIKIPFPPPSSLPKMRTSRLFFSRWNAGLMCCSCLRLGFTRSLLLSRHPVSSFSWRKPLGLHHKARCQAVQAHQHPFLGADGATPTCPYPAASTDLREERSSCAKLAAGKNVRSEFKQALSSGGAGKHVDFVQLNIVEEVEFNRVKSPRLEEMNTRAGVLPYSVICRSCSLLPLPMSWPESHVGS